MLYSIRPCTADEIPAVIQFFEEVWSPQHIFVRDPDFMMWQMDGQRDGNVAHPCLSALAAWDGPRLIGFLGLIACDFNRNGKRIPSYWMCNFSVRENYRASGAAAQLLIAALRLPVDVIAAAGIRPDIFHFFRAMKYRTIDHIPRFIRPIDARACARLIGCRLDRIRQVPVSPLSKDARVRVEALSFEEPALQWDQYWLARSRQGYLGVDRSSSYMRWRYEQHPRLEYRTVTARFPSGNEIAGHVVYRLERAREEPILVVRLIEFNADEAARQALLLHVEHVALQEGAIFIDHYNTNADPVFFSAPGWTAEHKTDPDPLFPSLFQPLYTGRHEIAAVVRFISRDKQLAEGFDGLFQFAKSDGDQDRPN
jgi:hypothetical protein